MDRNNEQTPTKEKKRAPMAHQKPPLSRRIQTRLARLGLIVAVAGGGAGAIHHVTDADLPVVPVGAIADNLGSTAVDTTVNIIHENLRAHIEPEDAAFGTTVIEKGVQIYKGLGPQVDPNLISNEVNWDDVTINGIALKDYLSISAENVLRKTVGVDSFNPKTYIVIRDAQVGTEKDDLTIWFGDPKLDRSKQTGSAYVFPNAKKDGYFAYHNNKRVDEMNVFSPGQPAVTATTP